MAVADASVADGETFQAQLINHPPSGFSRWVLKNATGAFLIERLTGAAFFVADANPLENFAVRLGGQLQFHREHNIIGRERSVTIFEGQIISAHNFYSAGGCAVGLDFANVGTDLRAVRSGIH